MAIRAPLLILTPLIVLIVEATITPALEIVIAVPILRAPDVIEREVADITPALIDTPFMVLSVAALMTPVFVTVTALPMFKIPIE